MKYLSCISSNLPHHRYHFIAPPRRSTTHFRNQCARRKSQVKLNQLRYSLKIDFFMLCPYKFRDLSHWSLHKSWNSIVRLSSNDWVLSCVIMNYELKWDYTDIRAFHYSKMVKSIPWIAISCWSREGHISVYIHWLTSVMFQVLRVWYWVTARCTFCLPAGYWLGRLSR